MERDTLSADVVATGITWDDYMAQYAHDFYEWVNGDVIKMTPLHERHDEIQSYLAYMLKIYFDLNPIGFIRQAPFVMKLPKVGSSREPDIQVILNNNKSAYTPTGMLDAADIVIEIVSPESVERDTKTKYAEYENGGVKEYWLINPLKNEAHIYARDENGKFADQLITDDYSYTTKLLPKLKVDTALLWNEPLPNVLDTVKAVTVMVQGAE